jgi:hypothetical protein
MLMGIAIRTGSPLSLNLAEPVWKQLAGMSLSSMDISEVDRDYLPGKENMYNLIVLVLVLQDNLFIYHRSILHP